MAGAAWGRQQPALLNLLDRDRRGSRAGHRDAQSRADRRGQPSSPLPGHRAPGKVSYPVPSPPVCPKDGGDRVRIYVADTGIVKETVNSNNFSWLTGVTGDDDPSFVAAGTILPYGGHGTFVGGVIRCMAPGRRSRGQDACSNRRQRAGIGVRAQVVRGVRVRRRDLPRDGRLADQGQ